MQRIMRLTLAAILAAGCGGLKGVADELQARARERAVEEVTEFATDQALTALEADDVATIAEDIDVAAGEDEATSAPGTADAAIGMAAHQLYEAAALSPTVNVVRYTCGALDPNRCRPSQITANEETKFAKVSAVINLSYYSDLAIAQADGTPDLNDAPANLIGYVRAEFTITRMLSGPDVTETTITTTGYRVWSLDPRDWYVVDTEWTTTGFPKAPNGRPTITQDHFRRTFAVPVTTNTQGSTHRTLTFSDGSTMSTDRYATYNRDTNKLTGTWLNKGRRGFEGRGTFDMNLGARARCRLDDSGTITIDRKFGEAVTQVTGERLEITQNANVITIKGTLTLSDGSTRTKELTRTVTKPTSCDDRTGVRTVTVTGTGYGGNQISYEETRSNGMLSIHATRTLQNGNVQTLDAVRSEGVLQITLKVTSATGDVLVEGHLVLHPGGNGEGEVTRKRGAETVTRKIVVEDGKSYLVDEDGNRHEMRHPRYGHG